MDLQIVVSFLLVFAALASGEKVLFGQPAPLAAEGREAPKETETKVEGRKSRVLTFPTQDSRTHQSGYVIPASHVDVTEDRFGHSANSLTDENRLLSLLPSFGNDGMQVGLDFKLPFFSIPYAKMFSALTAPTLGGGFLGSSSTYPESSSLGSNFLSAGSSGMATLAAMAATAALLYPKVSNMFSLKGGVFRDAHSADDFLANMNSVLNQFNIDGAACAKVALCSLGNAKRHQLRTRGRDASSSSTPADVLESILNLPAVKSMISKGGMVQARDFGGSGGDCDYFNEQKKCPVSSESFQKMLSSLG